MNQDQTQVPSVCALSSLSVLVLVLVRPEAVVVVVVVGVVVRLVQAWGQVPDLQAEAVRCPSLPLPCVLLVGPQIPYVDSRAVPRSPSSSVSLQLVVPPFCIESRK